MDASTDEIKPGVFAWLTGLLLSLNLAFLKAFFYRQFRPVTYPMHDFTGQTIIVTGANSGIGREAARHFVRLGAAKVILACRDTSTGEGAKADIELSLPGRVPTTTLEVWPLDLSSFDSVREFCARAEKQLPRLDVVVESAAVAYASSLGRLAEGYEQTVTVNVISTFLMALLLLPVLRRTAQRYNTTPRLSVVSSEAHLMTLFHEKDAPRIFDTFKSTHIPSDRYQTTKLIQILFIRELAERMVPNITKTNNSSPSYSFSSMKRQPVILNTPTPGYCRTALFRDNKGPAAAFFAGIGWLLARSAETGSRVLVHAAATPAADGSQGVIETHGKWLDTCEVREPSQFVCSEEGKRVQRRVYGELMEILERVEPGISENV